MNPSHHEIPRLIAELTARDADVKWIDTASRPWTVDSLGAAIAHRVRKSGPHAVACWLNEDDAVLAHCVARHLKVPVRRGEENLGLLTLDPDARVDERVVLVSTAWTPQTPLGPLFSLVENRGARVAAVVSLLPGAERPAILPPDVPFLVLAAS
jgi:hypothetical protein